MHSFIHSFALPACWVVAMRGLPSQHTSAWLAQPVSLHYFPFLLTFNSASWSFDRTDTARCTSNPSPSPRFPLFLQMQS
ncbi:hypothetical protein BKA61DRAFT_192872 [Leptodontidium sp. MPI-SDFR-AT-0119]|nr:hypothetical protein BKA61DRAFT_192872 [Leptodontidium sp. MPI-SDFR-AT-0119]